VAHACGISVRKLHALFERADGSFSHHILARRLDEARATLANHTLRDRSIADVAFGLGFNSLATFYRNYRARFDETPGDTRERTRSINANRV
jgi:transcriptional regulator GlxA family with amidase domain